LSRALKWAFGIGLALLLVGLLVTMVGAGSGGEALVLAGLWVLGLLLIFGLLMALRTPGWTRAYNPRGARRDLEAERAAAKSHEGEPGAEHRA
jgi:hypothetical protein